MTPENITLITTPIVFIAAAYIGIMLCAKATALLFKLDSLELPGIIFAVILYSAGFGMIYPLFGYVVGLLK